MNIKQIRLFQILAACAIVAFKKYTLLYYWGFMWASLEFLNSREEYSNQKYVKYYNAFFIAFQTLIYFNRLQTFHLTPLTEWLINRSEHILFAMIVCFKISQYLRLKFFPDFHPYKRFLFIAVGFNLLGIFNEFFQNWYTHRPLFVLLPDSLLDMQMNFIGTLLFLFLFYFIEVQVSDVSKTSDT